MKVHQKSSYFLKKEQNYAKCPSYFKRFHYIEYNTPNLLLFIGFSIDRE